MPELKNPRHEIVATLLAKRYSQSKAYAGAGFKPDPAHASKLCRDSKVQARVRELRAEMAASVAQTRGYEAEALFADVRKKADAAAKAGDHKTALAGAIFIVECFGYHDSPTLTHEKLLNVKLAPEHSPAHEGAPGVPEGEEDTPADGANVMRFSGVLSELRKKREAR